MSASEINAGTPGIRSRRKFRRYIAPFSREKLEQHRRMGFVTSAGVVYDEELAGRDGMRFILMNDRNTTPDMLVASCQELRANRDVVGPIYVAEVAA